MRAPLRRSIRGIFAYALAVIFLAQAGMALYAWTQFGSSLTPELERKTEALSLSLGGRIDKALGLGIPFNALEGTEDYFAEALARNRDIAFIALTSTAGDLAHVSGLSARQVAAVLASAKEIPPSTAASAVRRVQLTEKDHPDVSQVVSIALRQGEEAAGFLHLGVQRHYLDDKLAEIRIDILVVLTISLFVVLELMLFIMASHLLIPLADVDAQVARLARGDFSALIATRGLLSRIAELLNSYVMSVHALTAELLRRAGDRSDEMLRALNAGFRLGADAPYMRAVRPVTQVRLITFLFMFGEQLSRPFLPVFARGLMAEGTVGSSVWAGLPIAAFMLAVAVAMPVLTPWAERVGRRQSFLVGAACATIGLLGASLCFGFFDFIIWRVLTAVGYALMFMAGQGFVVDNTRDADRARGVAAFVGAIMVSELCAPGIGGIFADRLGPRPVFAIGAAIMVLTAFLGAQVLGRGTARASDPAPAAGRLGAMAVMRNVRFMVLLLAAAIPAKFALTGFMFYLVPVGLASLEVSLAETGRVAMLYALPSVVVAPLFARLADRLGWAGAMVGLGGMIGGAGFLPVLFWPSETTMAIGVLALGLGQAMSISPQLSLVTQTCADEVARCGAGGVLAVYRMVERGGAALGPVVAGILTAWLGPLEAAGVMGLAIFVCGVVFSVTFLVLGVHAESAVLVRTSGQQP